MSGTSLDGLDLAYCNFTEDEGKWSYKIIQATTLPYSYKWKKKLINLPEQDHDIIVQTDRDLGKYIGIAVSDFIEASKLATDIVASHGHTIFHEPEKRLTLQIGDAQSILDHCGITVINDFRSSDVAMGGQGAPLVPIGDRLLFSDFDYCLNIGGFANISYEENSKRIAFDICPANMVLNHLSESIGKSFDNKGMIAAGGSIVQAMVDELEALDYYTMTGPRSLGREWVETIIFPILNKYNEHPPEDLLASFTEHIALRIAAGTGDDPNQKMLLSGGGAYNDHLVSRMKEHCRVSIVVADPLIIEFKEAMIFAFLGVLRMREEVNVLGSVTGSGKDHSAGTILLR